MLSAAMIAAVAIAAAAPLCAADSPQRRDPSRAGARRADYTSPLDGAPSGRASRAGYLVSQPPESAIAPSPGVGPAQASQTLARIARDLEAAQQLEKDENPHCVDLYFWSAMRAWRVFGAVATPDESAFDDLAPAATPVASPDAEAQQLYNAALERLIVAGQHFKRLDPHSHLAIDDVGARRSIPIVCHGLVWEPADYCQLLPSKQFKSSRINKRFVAPGWGAPLVAVRALPDDEESSMRRQPFAVTALLRPTAPELAPAGEFAFADVSPGCPAALELYNPRLANTVLVAGCERPLALDLTAPLAMLQNTVRPQYFEGFVRPEDMNVRPELLMLEPYQAGKIPVIFIHGLFSDPLAWTNAANELMAQRDLYTQFQFWAYSYPTGGELLESAATLRAELATVRQAFDPNCEDPALENMVFITHSLGGLMGKLQITSSQDLIWRRMANVPLDAIQATPKVRAGLARLVYFEPSPYVRRVVFMGTPFKGSSWALRTVGRVSSSLVRFAGPDNNEYRELINANRGVFAPYMRRSQPTTVDMLEPDSPILLAIQEMPINPATRLHTVIGDGAPHLLREPSDGVVTVDSANHPGVESSLLAPALHTELHSYPEAINELMRILRLHLAESAPLPAGEEMFETRSPRTSRPTRDANGAGVRLAERNGAPSKWDRRAGPRGETPGSDPAPAKSIPTGAARDDVFGD